MPSRRLLFTCGSVLLFVTAGLPREAIAAGAATVAFCTIPWSVVQITPDLLLSGIFAAAAGMTISERWGSLRAWAAASGGVWGLAYLTKAVAFPIAGLTVLALAIMHWRVMGRTDAGTWLEIQLETGRTHQIRVQSASRGHAVVGDSQYGATQPFGEQFEDERLRAIALHARQLGFIHPMTRELVDVTAPLPAAWNALGLPVDL